VTTLREQAEQYLQLRRALGYKLADHGHLLMQFIGYLEQQGAATVTIEAAVTWAMRPAAGTPSWWRYRLAVVRCFARHLASADPHCQVPPANLLPRASQRQAPYLFTPTQIQALIDAPARLFRQPLRIATYQALISLLWVTGMRTGEAIRLDRDHLDLSAGHLDVIDSKYGKSRTLLLHATTVSALAGYAELRDQAAGQAGSPAFFVSTRGRLLVNTVDYTFAGLVAAAGITVAPGVRAPRPTDLRHSFAVTTLTDWYRSGADVCARLPVLSTWMGHLSPASTYWYLQASPELLAQAAKRLEDPIPPMTAGGLSWPRSRRSFKRSSPTTW